MEASVVRDMETSDGMLVYKRGMKMREGSHGYKLGICSVPS